MIYTAVSSSITESGNFTPISAIDAIMDINEALIEYNETSYLYEGVGDNIKNLVRNIGTKVSNAINTLIQKIRQMMMDNAFKRFEKLAKSDKKQLSSAASTFEYKVLRNAEHFSTNVELAGNRIKKGSSEISTEKESITKSFKDGGDAYETKNVNGGDFKTVITDLKSQATKAIDALSKTKDTALKALKTEDDATAASKYANFVIWACNLYSNKILSTTISTINRANKKFEKKTEEKK